MKTRIPIGPLRFGTENDFNLALNELRWKKEINGELSESDFESVSLKYSFPKEFLKQGLKGLSLNDYIVSKSKWFPIVYSWRKHWEFMRTRYFKHIVWYSRSKFVYLTCGIAIVLAFFYLISLHFFGRLDLINTISIAFALALFGIPFLYHLHEKEGQWGEKLVELEDEIRKDGMKEIVESAHKFMAKFKIFFVAVGSPKKFLKWISSAIPLSAFPLGEIESFKGGKSVRIPVAFVENPDKAHAQRWKKLLNVEE